VDAHDLDIYPYTLVYRILPTVGGGGRQCPALNSTAQHQTKTDSSAQHKNTPEIFVNMKIIVAILKFLSKIYVSE
jgi:hypothetical protein